MNESELFQVALGLSKPWLVKECRFDVTVWGLDIHLDFPQGSVFDCPVCHTAGCKAYDTDELTWRHLNFFQHQTFLHARTPRVSCTACGVHRIAVPWARPDSGFTLLFEALVMMLDRAMPVLAVGRCVGEHATLIWRIIRHYVDVARGKANHSAVTRVGLDETASRRGQQYVSLFVDLDHNKVLFVAPGKDATTVGAFAEDLKAHAGDPLAVSDVSDVSADMSKAFSKGVTKSLPNATVTFDKFHVVSLVNDAVDQVRRIEREDHPELARTRYLWLKNPENLSASQGEKFDAFDVLHSNLQTARAYEIKLAFQELYNQAADHAEAYLNKWYYWATHSRIPAIIKVAKSIRQHQPGILRWFTSRINNGILEGINSLVQDAKAKARGYRSDRNLATLIYLIAGKLDFILPT